MERLSLIKNFHPCFSEKIHQRFGRIHLPVAGGCNIKCGYCDRRYDCPNESRPGVTSTLLSPDEALRRAGTLIAKNPALSVIGIAGPGEPLANNAALDTFRLIRERYVEPILCLSTNGLLLADRVMELIEAGVSSITITINAINSITASRIYKWIRIDNTIISGEPAANYLIRMQRIGLEKAVKAGLVVKINSVLIPDVNENEMEPIARMVASHGAYIMNIIPLIPQAEFTGLRRPSRDSIDSIRVRCAKYIGQMTHCRQCRADALGLLGDETDAELEMINSNIGMDYCESIR